MVETEAVNSRYHENLARLEGRVFSSHGYDQHVNVAGVKPDNDLKWERRGYGPPTLARTHIEGLEGDFLSRKGFEIFGIPRVRGLTAEEKVFVDSSFNKWEDYFGTGRQNTEDRYNDWLEEAREAKRQRRR